MVVPDILDHRAIKNGCSFILVGIDKVQDCFDVERISCSISRTIVANDAKSRRCYAAYRARDTAYTA